MSCSVQCLLGSFVFRAALHLLGGSHNMFSCLQDMSCLLGGLVLLSSGQLCLQGGFSPIGWHAFPLPFLAIGRSGVVWYCSLYSLQGSFVFWAASHIVGGTLIYSAFAAFRVVRCPRFGSGGDFARHLFGPILNRSLSTEMNGLISIALSAGRPRTYRVVFLSTGHFQPTGWSCAAVFIACRAASSSGLQGGTHQPTTPLG